MIFGSRYQADQVNRRTRGPVPVARLLDFGNWSDYVDGPPPVLLVRVTPKMVESLWTTVARGAALTQGAAIPAIKHVKSGFSRLRAYCGESEVTPIHPFVLEQRVSDKDTIAEGFYVRSGRLRTAVNPSLTLFPRRIRSAARPARSRSRHSAAGSYADSGAPSVSLATSGSWPQPAHGRWRERFCRAELRVCRSDSQKRGYTRSTLGRLPCV